jgi:alkylhydroperoxidase/carboxymuconolactone decarboxylase family protein YurZ
MMAVKKPVAKNNPVKKLKYPEKRIENVPRILTELTTNDPAIYNLVIRMEDHIWDDGKLSKTPRKLIGIAIAAALRDHHPVRTQLMGAANPGITKAEVEVAFRGTFLLSGMPACIDGEARIDEVMKK